MSLPGRFKVITAVLVLLPLLLYRPIYARQAPRERLMPGDVTLDGLFDRKDLSKLSRLVSRDDKWWKDEQYLFPCADLDFNGKVDQKDVEYLSSYLKEREKEFSGRLALFNILLSIDFDESEALESFVENIDLDAAGERGACILWLLDFLERGGGLRLPEPGEPGWQAPVHARAAAIQILTSLLEVDALLLDSSCASPGRVLCCRRRLSRFFEVLKKHYSVDRPLVRSVKERLETVSGILDKLSKQARPVKHAALSPATSPASQATGLSTPVAQTISIPENPSTTLSAIPTKALTKTRYGTDIVTSAVRTEACAKSSAGSTDDGIITALVSFVSHHSRNLLTGLGIFLSAVLIWHLGKVHGRKTVELRPLEPLMAGEMLLRRKDYEGAIEEFQAIIDGLDGEHANPARLRLCLALACLGEADKAAGLLDSLDLSRADNEVIYRLGLQFERIGRTGAALRVFSVLADRSGSYRDLKSRIEALSPCVEPDDVRAIERLLSDRYFDYRVLHRGRDSVVYRVRDVELQRDVALKVMRSGSVGPRFAEDIAEMASFEYDSIVSVYDFGQEKFAWFSMEFVEGEPLDLLIDTGRLSKADSRVRKIALELARTLEYLEGRGLVHGDVNPRALVVLPQNRVKLIGFGSAWLDTKERSSAVRMPAPEIDGGHEHDTLSEIYSFGASLCAMIGCSARRPATGESTRPRGLEKIALKALSTRRAGRYQGFSPIVKELQRLSL